MARVAASGDRRAHLLASLSPFVQLSYAEFQKYLDSINITCDFIKDVVPQIKTLATDTIKAVSRKMDP